jgi:hypothetical protein
LPGTCIINDRPEGFHVRIVMQTVCDWCKRVHARDHIKVLAASGASTCINSHEWLMPFFRVVS